MTGRKGNFPMATSVRILFALTMLGAVVRPALAMQPHNPKHFLGAPGPIVGAGLPIIAVGYGVYWLVKRRRQPD